MTPILQNPLRNLTEEERAMMERIARATSERSDVRQRACALLLVAAGASASAAAKQAGYTSGEGVKQLVLRFHMRGLNALVIAPGRGRKVTYPEAERQQVLDTFHQPPDREKDGSATWSLKLIAHHVHHNGLPQIASETIRQILHHNGQSSQRSRSWCPTGTAKRKRTEGVVLVHDPQAEAKRGRLKQPIR